MWILNSWQTAIDPRDNAIYSICEGTIMVTTEKFDSNTENDYVQKFYERRPLESNIYKRYIHVLPLKPKQEFKLINLI